MNDRVRLLYISPHADDVCFSLLGTIGSLYAEGELVTVFSRSEWAEPDWDGPRGAELITAARAREDRAFCAVNGLSYQPLGFEDSSIRHGLKGNLRRPSGETQLINEVAGRLSEVLKTGDVGMIFAPLGLGGHTDHRITSSAAKLAAGAAAKPIAFYEDIPYATELTMRGIRKVARELDTDMEPVICLSDLSVESKVQAARLYRSQRKDQILQAMEFHSYRLRDRVAGVDPFGVAERMWVRGGEEMLRDILGPRPSLVADKSRLGARVRARALLID